MKKKFVLYIFLISFFILSVSKAKIETKIIIKIGNEIVTNYDVKNEIVTLLVLADEEINQKNINQLKKRAVNSLIDSKLMKIELSKYNIKDNNTRVNKYLSSISSNDIEGLKKKFNQNNLNFQFFLEKIENQMKWQNLIYQLYSKKIRIDENLVNDEINDALKNKNKNIIYKISEIEIILENNENIDKKIYEIQNLIDLNGFENTALKFSSSPSSINKGDLGWINASSLSKVILKIVGEMSVGEISNPLKRRNSILFLKLSNKKVSEVEVDVDKLRANIIKKKQNELFNLYSQSHLSKLKNNNLIEYK